MSTTPDHRYIHTRSVPRVPAHCNAHLTAIHPLPLVFTHTLITTPQPLTSHRITHNHSHHPHQKRHFFISATSQLESSKRSTAQNT
ncbi:hypothetical protein P167DRAFT_357156 [Morchella conica CCBAS932]|uniref:Uncharacterized protein n=1 Tax=Morchella conica CCBAS932 TaxID=1392247 RepID=A0A3N4KD50_9PEZI|nr:hypothetical protein P167DRAFT_357156 [Morchella conica CCBAS932]